ncbi:hypothetical protein RF55_6369 [Lasius niger]|uniref:Uncharacterized protein n=1 Tax=Lasius niger TaxID=67767 RepID=A0A0J7NM16_LASNI|nr:hypothetical protein RF55_6369 [Lasius niger]
MGTVVNINVVNRNMVNFNVVNRDRGQTGATRLEPILFSPSYAGFRITELSLVELFRKLYKEKRNFKKWAVCYRTSRIDKVHFFFCLTPKDPAM